MHYVALVDVDFSVASVGLEILLEDLVEDGDLKKYAFM